MMFRDARRGPPRAPLQRACRWPAALVASGAGAWSAARYVPAEHQSGPLAAIDAKLQALGAPLALAAEGAEAEACARTARGGAESPAG